MSITSAISEAVESVAVWLNPEKKERRVLQRAVEAAEQIIMILEKTGRYAGFTDAKRAEYLIHYRKQFVAWKDGTP
jgi:hypothetical protein